MLVVTCKECGKEIEVKGVCFELPCPNCGSEDVDVEDVNDTYSVEAREKENG